MQMKRHHNHYRMFKPGDHVKIFNKETNTWYPYVLEDIQVSEDWCLVFRLKRTDVDEYGPQLSLMQYYKGRRTTKRTELLDQGE